MSVGLVEHVVLGFVGGLCFPLGVVGNLAVSRARLRVEDAASTTVDVGLGCGRPISREVGLAIRSADYGTCWSCWSTTAPARLTATTAAATTRPRGRHHQEPDRERPAAGTALTLRGACPTRIWASITAAARPTTIVSVAYLFLFIWMELPSDEWTGVIVFYDHEVALAFQRKLFLINLALVFHDAKVLFLVPVEQHFDVQGREKTFGSSMVAR